MRKIMFRKDNNNNMYEYAVPSNLQDLKALVNAGWCVCTLEKVLEDFRTDLLNCDDYFVLSKHNLKDNWRDIPALDINEAIEILNAEDELIYNNDVIITKDDYEEILDMWLNNASESHVCNAYYAYEEIY